MTNTLAWLYWIESAIFIAVAAALGDPILGGCGVVMAMFAWRYWRQQDAKSNST